MNCEKYRAQIEELTSRQQLEREVLRHLENCDNCRAYSRECQKLGEMLACLQTVGAPNDFNFHLKSKLKREARPAPVWTWRRVAGGTTAATLAALTLGFVLTNNLSPSFQTAQANTNSAPTVTAQQVQQIDRAIIEDSFKPLPQTELEAPQEIVQTVEKRKSRFVQSNSSAVKPLRRKAPAKNSNEEILVRDSATDGVSERAVTSADPQIMPKGIPNPLLEPQKQDARGILKTLGVETETNGEGFLRVVKSNRVDLQTDDIIQTVNGENPVAVTGGKLEEIKLTIRRKGQTKEVKILAKP